MATSPYFMNFHSNTLEFEDYDLSKISSLSQSFPFQQTQSGEYNQSVVECYERSSDSPQVNPSYMENMANSTHSKEKETIVHPTKQVTHKVIEKKRRREMNDLYSQLRSLLPHESLRGKRSISDQLLEAVNYVRHLEQQIRDLTKQKDNRNIGSVFSRALEVSVTLEFNKSEEAGLEIVTAASFATSERFFHVVYTKVANPNPNNIDELCVKLRHLIMERKSQDGDADKS
ncbi:transcription factor ORG2 isoform X2 [Cryptomeria japonica]|uniref:transcription factor ORG2 isoform X2 n=1 Tax=Cryptomeria japonica TaxID=3369 RepID=UPI0025ABFE39|nr:transcription factor ORG2 isoform X2 [Cryptomeria japonica]